METSVPSYSILTSNVTFGNASVPTHAFVTDVNGSISLKRNDGGQELLKVTGNAEANFFIGNGSQLTGLAFANASILSIGTIRQDVLPQTIGNAMTTYIGNGSQLSGVLTTNASSLTQGTLNASVFPQTIGNSASIFTGNGFGLHHVNGANIDGNIESSLLLGTLPQSVFPSSIGNSHTVFVGDGGLLSNTQGVITGAATTITSSNLTSQRVVISDSNGKVAASNTTSTELDFLRGLSSNVQEQLNSKPGVITGAATTIVIANLTPSRAVLSNSLGKVDVSNVTASELEYVSGVTGSLQPQLNSKQATVTGAATSVVSSNLTSSKALVSDALGKIAASTTASSSLAYLDGVTSSIQSQLDGKLSRNVNTWLVSDDGANRLRFSASSKTTFGSRNGYEWQGSSNTNIMTLSDAATLSMTNLSVSTANATTSISTPIVYATANVIVSNDVTAKGVNHIGSAPAAYGGQMGYYLGWNFGLNGATYLINSKGSGSGGFIFAEWNGSSYPTTAAIDASGNFTIAGSTASKPGGGSWASSSDKRIKQNIEDANVDLCWNIVKALPLKRFEYTPDYVTASKVDDVRVTGWIADEVQAVFPKAVHTQNYMNYDDLKLLDVDQLYKTMWGALSKAMTRIEEMQSRIDFLENLTR